MRIKTVATFCLLAAAPFCVRTADATVIISVEQVGPNVVATASGTIDLTGLTYYFSGAVQAFMTPSSAILHLGNGAEYDAYSGISGPTSFGTGGDINATSGTGDPFAIVGLSGADYIDVPEGYVSGTPLSSTATWDDATIADLGIIPGAYTYSWGPGADDSITYYAGIPIPPFSVPEPESALLITLGGTALALLTRKWRKAPLASRF